MRNKTHVFLLAALTLCAAGSTLAQTVQYPDFTVPIYRYAKNQRFSEHKKIAYIADINEQLGAALLPNKSKQFNRDAFLKSVMEEMTASGLTMALDGDLMVAIDVDNFAAAASTAPDMLGNATYNLSGSAQLALLNKKTEIYFIKPLNLSSTISLKTSEMIKNSFTHALASQKAI